VRLMGCKEDRLLPEDEVVKVRCCGGIASLSEGKARDSENGRDGRVVVGSSLIDGVAAL
jgi:hypothetical protein